MVTTLKKLTAPIRPPILDKTQEILLLVGEFFDRFGEEGALKQPERFTIMYVTAVAAVLSWNVSDDAYLVSFYTGSAGAAAAVLSRLNVSYAGLVAATKVSTDILGYADQAGGFSILRTKVTQGETVYMSCSAAGHWFAVYERII